MESPTLRFAAAVRTLSDAARARHLVVPNFRSPPGVAAHRTITVRRGVPTVAVRLRSRPWPAVVADLVEGVVVANGLRGLAADRVRDEMWAALADELAMAA